MENLYLNPQTEPGGIRVVELKSAADFERAFEDIQKGQVVLAHGYCTKCSAITYYVRDCNMDGLSHICSKCGIRFCFQHGDKCYIDMDDYASCRLSPHIKKEIARLNSLSVQKALLDNALAIFLEGKKNVAKTLNEEIHILETLFA